MTNFGFQDLMDENKVFRALVKGGFFSEKLVPFFDSSHFFEFILAKPAWLNSCSKKASALGYVRHRIVSHNHKIRTIAIPHPHGYGRLCQCIKENWTDINSHIGCCWEGKAVNMVRVRNLSKTPDKIFEMNYSSRIGENDFERITRFLSGNKYLVKADISNCFPSIYTHSIHGLLSGGKKHMIDEVSRLGLML